jgi:hypothetical protein
MAQSRDELERGLVCFWREYERNKPHPPLERAREAAVSESTPRVQDNTPRVQITRLECRLR